MYEANPRGVAVPRTERNFGIFFTVSVLYSIEKWGRYDLPLNNLNNMFYFLLDSLYF